MYCVALIIRLMFLSQLCCHRHNMLTWCLCFLPNTWACYSQQHWTVCVCVSFLFIFVLFSHFNHVYAHNNIEFECMLVPVASHFQCLFYILLQCLMFIMTSFPFKGCDELVCNVFSLKCVFGLAVTVLSVCLQMDTIISSSLLNHL